MLSKLKQYQSASQHAHSQCDDISFEVETGKKNLPMLTHFSALSSHMINFSSSKSMTPYPTSDEKSMDMYLETIKTKQFLSACISNMKLYSDIH